jgi:hypothetical protein
MEIDQSMHLMATANRFSELQSSKQLQSSGNCKVAATAK